MAGTFNSPRQEISRKRLTVPRGFRNLLEGLTTEILRSNPSDIYTFAADYFKSRLQERQGGKCVYNFRLHFIWDLELKMSIDK